jgi:Arc/MetJ-type ribon-helix-helix transcriptional regulator
MPLKPFRVTANLPGEIQELVDRRVKEEKYPSVSAYVVGLVLFDLHVRRRHLLTGELMREPQWLRDQVIAELVRDFDKLEGKPGSWFEHRIEELLQQRRAAGEDGKGK